MSVQRCQEETTSGEFLEWMIHLENQWNDPDRLDHYLAALTAEVKNVQVMFSTSKRSYSAKDCLLEFKPVDSGEGTNRNKPTPVKGRQEIEIGPDAIKDPKWAKVNEAAKATWLVRLGMTGELGNVQHSTP